MLVEHKRMAPKLGHSSKMGETAREGMGQREDGDVDVEPKARVSVGPVFVKLQSGRGFRLLLYQSEDETYSRPWLYRPESRESGVLAGYPW